MHVTLPALVSVLVDLAVGGEPVLMRCARPKPEDLFAFLMFRRAWPHGPVVCQFVGAWRAN